MQFLYMARRDKFTIEVISTFRGDFKYGFKRNLQTKDLQLENDQKFHLDNFYKPQRFDWELVVENFESYHKLRESLQKRGYKHIPTSYREILPTPKRPFIEKFS